MNYPMKPERVIRPGQIEGLIVHWEQQVAEAKGLASLEGNTSKRTRLTERARVLQQCAAELRELL